MKLEVSKMPNLKASQAGFNGFERSPVESWSMTEKVDHGNNYSVFFSGSATVRPSLFDIKQNHSGPCVFALHHRMIMR